MITKLIFILTLISSVGLADKYPITVVGGDESSFNPNLDQHNTIRDATHYDVIIVGSGLAGLSAAIYLTKQNKNVLVLEKEDHFGGLAANGVSQDGIKSDRGAAYWTAPYPEEEEILKEIGLGDYEKKYPITEPIDSYFLIHKNPDGTTHENLYEGIWDEALPKLPTSYAVFKYELKKANKAGQIPDQPIEEAKNKTLDHVNAAAWIRKMPELLSRRRDKVSMALYKKFLNDPRLSKNDPMSSVVRLMNLYCRSALGTTCDQVSAIGFANFYISEIETRYTTAVGTSQAAENMVAILQNTEHTKLATLMANSPVGKITPSADQKTVEVLFEQNGKVHSAVSNFVIFSAQLKAAPEIITGFNLSNPSARVNQQVRTINKLAYAHYSVHTVEAKGHPYRASYDTWTHSSDYTENDFTDVILGLWMDPRINGYDGYRDFKKNPADPINSIFTIYQALPLAAVDNGSNYDDKFARDVAEKSVERMKELYNPLLKKRWNTEIQVMSVQTSRWPYSVHVAAPEHFSVAAKILRQPFGNIYFANNNIGTPAFEEALFRGHCAAINVLIDMHALTRPEPWSKCPR